MSSTEPGDVVAKSEQAVRPDEPLSYNKGRVIFIAMIASMGGLILGYDTGQISGLLAMRDYMLRFSDLHDFEGQPIFSRIRSGVIVAVLSFGTFNGSLMAAPLADKLGRKISIIICNFIFLTGAVIQITTNRSWLQMVTGRLISGIGVGSISVLIPMYQSETAPRQIRGALVTAYQLYITFGILTAYCVNFFCASLSGSASWRTTMGVNIVWPVLLGIGIVFLPESARWDVLNDRGDRARATIARTYGVSEDHPEVLRELADIQDQLAAEHGMARNTIRGWTDVFKGPKMAFRTILGMTLQALQQLTGANFFFYFGTTIFKSIGVENSYITSIILGAVNFGTTFIGLYIVEHFGRRKTLIGGGIWMFTFFMIFASLGTFMLNHEAPHETPQVGIGMITSACLFIAGFAATWGPVVWAITGELFPTRHRAKCMALATATNWSFNFTISFLTPFVTSVIGYRWGYVFASGCLAGSAVAYFFVCESQGRSLEEVDSMYLSGVKAWDSAKWKPSENLDATPIAKEAATSGDQPNV